VGITGSTPGTMAISLAHFAMCETTTTGTPTLSAEGRKVWGVAGGRAGGCGVVLTP
jgi:hypothetical protein